MLFFGTIYSLVLKEDLLKLERFPSRVSLSDFFRDWSNKHSYFSISIGFLGSIALTVAELLDTDVLEYTKH
jgi:hypothetical protein